MWRRICSYPVEWEFGTMILSFDNVSCSLSDTWCAKKRRNIFFTRPTNTFLIFDLTFLWFFDFFVQLWVPCVPKNHFSAPYLKNSIKNPKVSLMLHVHIHSCTCMYVCMLHILVHTKVHCECMYVCIKMYKLLVLLPVATLLLLLHTHVTFIPGPLI